MYSIPCLLFQSTLVVFASLPDMFAALKIRPYYWWSNSPARPIAPLSMAIDVTNVYHLNMWPHSPMVEHSMSRATRRSRTRIMYFLAFSLHNFLIALFPRLYHNVSSQANAMAILLGKISYTYALYKTHKKSPKNHKNHNKFAEE